MTDFIQLSGYFALIGAASFGAAWVIGSVRSGRWKVHTPTPGAIMRLRAGQGVYRSRFVRANGGEWIISAPLSRDNYVPLRVGEDLKVEAPTTNGVYLFRTTVLNRDLDSHEFSIKKPAEAHRVDRRDEPRITDVEGLTVVIEGQLGWLVDLSTLGAKVATKARLSRGERISLELPGVLLPVFGWVLDTQPASVGGAATSEVRVRFESVLDPKEINKKAAPVV